MKTTFKQALLVLGIILLSSLAAQSQKNRPVAGDCITLIEILQTDYTLIDDDNIRTDRIIQDRKRVVSIIKNYLPGDYKRPDSVIYKTAMSSINVARQALKITTDEIQILNSEKIEPQATLKRRGQVQSKQAAADALTINYDKVDQTEYDLFHEEVKALLAATNDNQFLQTILNEFKTKYKDVKGLKPDTQAAGYLGLTIQKSGPPISGGALTFTEAIDGLSKFIVKRVKEELANQVFSKISAKLDSPAYAEFRIVFPKTTAYMTGISTDQYSRMFATLKEHIQADLNELQNNLPKIANTKRVADLIKIKPELRFVLEGLEVLNQLQTVDNPLEIVFVLENSTFIQDWSAQTKNRTLFNLANSLKFTSLFVNTILVQETGNASILSLDSWKSHSGNLDFYNLFLGLLLQQDMLFYKIGFQIDSGQVTTLNSLLKDFAKNAETFKYDSLHARFGKPIENFLYEAESISHQLNEIRRLKRQGAKIGRDTLITVLNSALSAVQKTGHITMDLLDLINPKKNTIAFELTFDDYIHQSRQVVSIYNYILGKSYIQAATTAWTSFLTISKYDVPAHTREQVTRITDFLISSSRAEDPDQFASAIENFALPSGSSSIKRKSIFNLSINTYPGVYLSGERLTGISSNKKDTLWAFNTGVAVPIGLAANWGLKNKDVFTIFASVIDIGAFTSFRFKDNNSALPEIDLKNILAPGIHLIYGVANSPFSVGAALQYGPLSREVKISQDGSTTKIDVSSFRLGLTFTFDIPLFNIYTDVD